MSSILYSILSAILSLFTPQPPPYCAQQLRCQETVLDSYIVVSRNFLLFLYI